jgi:hypothetical protein
VFAEPKIFDVPALGTLGSAAGQLDVMLDISDATCCLSGI